MAKKIYFLSAVGCVMIGVVGILGAQYVMKETGSGEFCVSCHSMSYPQAEWEGSVHYSNRKGIRAECADCHVLMKDWIMSKLKL